MSLITRMRRQVAVWWKRTGHDGYGAPTFDAPVEIKCRWEDVQKEFVAPDTTRAISKSVVYVDRVIAVGDFLLRGHLVDLGQVLTPAGNDTAFEVMGFDRLPNLKNTEELLTAYL